MKHQELIVLGLAGVAVYMIWKSQTAKGGTGTARTVDNFVDEIFSSAGLPFNNGWRYFENGVAIGPDGTYYQNGVVAWKP